jgi:DNA-binding FadR family transcriptional regulator
MSRTPATTSQTAIADTMRRWLALGRYLPGDNLPTERALAETFGVGRMTVRAAVRDLIGEGLLATSRGRGGGTVVLEWNSRRIADLDYRTLAQDVRSHFEFRLAIEPVSARLTAERATKAARVGIVRLAQQDPETLGAYRAVDARLHLAIARASGNPLIAEATATARADFFRWADAIWHGNGWESLPKEMQTFREQHEPVAFAVRDRDADAAEALMRTHLEDALSQYLEALRALRRRRRAGAP